MRHPLLEQLPVPEMESLARQADLALMALVAGLLVTAAIQDVAARRIPNRLVAAVTGLAVFRLALMMMAGAPALSAVVWPALTGLGVFLAGLGLFRAGLMGGGDVKLLSALALFIGPAALPPFLIMTALAGGLLAAGMMGTRLIARRQSAAMAEAPPATVTLPYGVAISAGGLWVLARMAAESAF
ncbi:A24 family peptidase [Yunchengibacter salinarum]|uniref:A24 family peptidase n=1 Tax=Yunchengibacter salinarum TaxID=3133399 RepID=UPI0035B5D10A